MEFIPKRVEENDLDNFDFTINCGGWSNDDYYDVLINFPNGKHNDQG